MVSLTHHYRGPPSPSWARVFDWNAEFSFSMREKVAVRPDEGLVVWLGFFE